MSFIEDKKFLKELKEKNIYSDEKIKNIYLSIVRKNVDNENTVIKIEDEAFDVDKPYTFYILESNIEYYELKEWFEFYQEKTGKIVSIFLHAALSQVIQYITRNFKKIIISIECTNKYFIITFHDSTYMFELNPGSKAGFKYKKIK